MVRISNIALSLGLLTSVHSYGMENSTQHALGIEELINALSPEERERSRQVAKDMWEAEGRLTSEQRATRRKESIFDHVEVKLSWSKEITDYLDSEDKEHKHSSFNKIPTPKHITLLSKEITPKDKVTAFKAMMTSNPTILVVKDSDTLKNRDIKKIREIGNYTLLGDSNHKWVIDNSTGVDIVLSQETIEKLMQLSTESIEVMIEHGCLHEENIDKCPYFVRECEKTQKNLKD